jgi:hypothetical protein
MAIYRVPLRKVFNKKRLDGDPTWNDVYGKQKCRKCKKNFRESDPYRTVIVDRVLKFEHVECSK